MNRPSSPSPQGIPNHPSGRPVAPAGQRSSTTRAWMIAAVLAALAASPAHAADPDLERENLARIAHEIERVQVMVQEAAQAAPGGQRVRFRYDWLLSDLKLLRDGVVEHADAPRQPRPVPPLRGDYRQ